MLGGATERLAQVAKVPAILDGAVDPGRSRWFADGGNRTHVEPTALTIIAYGTCGYVVCAERNGYGDRRTVPVLGMPGNPVSAMVSFELFVRPAILKMRGLTEWGRSLYDGVLDGAIASKDDRRHYVRVQVEERDGVLHAALTGEQGSGILNSMVKAKAFAVIPEDWDAAPPGAHVKVIFFD